MASASLTLHRGARPVSAEELAKVPCPPPEGRWVPVPHHAVLSYATDALKSAGYEIDKMDLGLARDDQRFWGAMVLKSPVATGVSLACLVASSLDKSTSLRWAVGHRVWACDNGAWSAEQTIAKRHTTNAVRHYRDAIIRCVVELDGYRQVEANRIKRMQQTEVTDHFAEAALLRLYQDEGILSPQTLPVALKEWRAPSFEEFTEHGKSVWRLFNACTFALAPRLRKNPAIAADATIRLGGILTPATEVHAAQAA